MDEIIIDNLKVYAYHGVLESEKKEGQDFFISAKLYLDFKDAALTDALENTADYGSICAFITKYMTEHTYKLIETVACKLADAVLIEFPILEKIELSIHKPHAPINVPFDDISVKISRKYHTAYLSIGSNLGDRKAHLDYAVFALNKVPGTTVVKTSKYIETAPIGYIDQPDFLNGAICIRTLLLPEDLLNCIHSIENDEKRERIVHWGPRTLDIDIILYDNLVYSSDTLSIPHLRMYERNFVLEPLCEIAANVIHPVLHKTIAMLKEDIKPVIPDMISLTKLPENVNLPGEEYDDLDEDDYDDDNHETDTSMN